MISLENKPKFEITKREKSYFNEFINTILLLCVACAIIIVALAMTTKITANSVIDWKEQGIQGALLYICTVSVSILMRQYGTRKGRETNLYRIADLKIVENSDKIVALGAMDKRRSYCRQWEKQELKNAQEIILSAVGVDYEIFSKTYCKFNKKELRKGFPNMMNDQIKGILKAKKLKLLHYDENYLTSRMKSSAFDRRRSPSGKITVETLNVISNIWTLITAGATSLLSISLVLEIITDTSFATIVTCLIKIIFIVVAAISSTVNGYSRIITKGVLELEDHAREQENFIMFCTNEEKGQSV